MKSKILTLALICLSTVLFSQELFQVKVKSTVGCKDPLDLKLSIKCFESGDRDLFQTTLVDFFIVEKCTPFSPGEVLILLYEDKEHGILKVRKSGFDQIFWIKEFIVN